MRNTVTLVTSLLLSISPIMGDIKDFIIENETDLKRFGFADEPEDPYDTDMDTDWMYNDCGGGGNSYNSYGDYMTNEVEGIDYDASQIDPNLLREIVRQMKNDPRFEHLWEHLDEDNILADRQTPQPDEEDNTNFYIDFDDYNGIEEIE